MPGLGQLSVRSYGKSHASHDHPHYQVLVGLDGTLELEVDGRGRRISPGDGCVVAPGARHDFEAGTGSRCLVLDSTDTGWSHCDATPGDNQSLQPLARFLAAAIAQQRPEDFSHALRLGPLLLLEAWTPLNHRRPSSRRRIDWAALTTWAAARWQGTITVQDLASRVCLSSTQFTARCQQETGLSPMAWLRLQRLSQARQLQAQGLSVAASARRVGYRSPSALTAAGRRLNGA